MRLLALLRQVLSTVRHDESGQSLVVVISSMTVLLGVAGFGIDTANWMVHHHDAQVVADSAALAAAQCLAQPNQPSTIEVNGQQVTLPPCTSSTDTYDASTVAVEYAAANGLTIGDSNVSFDGKVVTVTASTTTPSIFARVLGIGTMSQSARAGAGFKSNPGQCTTAGQTCDFMFANSSICTTGSDALNLSTQGSSSVNGNIQTNGNLVASGTGNAGGVNGTGNYGPGSGCNSTTGGNHDPWQTGDPTQDTKPLTWPIDYSKDFPACVQNSTTNPCSTITSTYGYPSYCTQTGSDIVLNDTIPADQASPGQIYCASGPDGNPSDPSTWDGTITITMSANNTIEDSFIGGRIIYSGAGNDTFSACGWTATGYSSSSCSAPAPLSTTNYPIFYAVGQDPTPSSCAAGTSPSSTCAFYMHSNGNFTLDGDMFVQNGTASFDFHGNQSAANTFIEANTISANLDGNFNGDGPTLGSTNNNGGSGSISLVQ